MASRQGAVPTATCSAELAGSMLNGQTGQYGMSSSTAYRARKSSAAAANPAGRRPLDRLRGYLDTRRMKDKRRPRLGAGRRDFHAEVTVLANVIAIRSDKPRKAVSR